MRVGRLVTTFCCFLGFVLDLAVIRLVCESSQSCSQRSCKTHQKHPHALKKSGVVETSELVNA